MIMWHLTIIYNQKLFKSEKKNNPPKPKEEVRKF